MGGDAQPFDAWQIELHGHRVDYRIAGDGPPVVLIHGMVNSSRHWEHVALRLADRYTVIAPDLIGHGDSATPRGDYSLGAHAAVIRDVLSAIGIERASIVGHSLGGGVAMQFFWQFPERTERLVLVSSGGLGHEVSPLLRTVALPRASLALSVLAHPPLLRALWEAGERLARPPGAARRLGEGGRAPPAPRRPPPGGSSRAAPARAPGRARALPADAARCHRPPRPARQRARPPLPARVDAHADRLGWARPHD